MGFFSRLMPAAAAGALAISGLPMLAPTASAVPVLSTPVTGAAFTTVNETVDGTGHCANGNPGVNCNIYDGKEYVWASGGPISAAVGDGDYFFAVLEPGGQGGTQNPNDGTDNNLSDLDPTTGTGAGDDWTNRRFTISDGVISYSGTHDFSDNLIRLFPYDDTPNPGGVYILAICNLADATNADATGTGTPGVDPSDCKYDAFKVDTDGGGGPAYDDPTVTKSAAGDYDTTYDWDIDKAVDKTLVKQVGGSATFDYTVTVTGYDGVDSGWEVGGTITAINPNADAEGNIIPITGVNITDVLSTDATCSVTGGVDATLSSFVTEFPYTCVLTAAPPDDLANTVTMFWAEQTGLTAGSTEFTATPIPFTQNKIDETVDVTDSYAGSLGTLTNPDDLVDGQKSFTYSRTVEVPSWDCVTYDNTATFTTTDTGATGSDSQSVTVCGPVKTGALTMGFWQNKNGQSIIANSGSTYGVCNLTPWLRGFAPFQDLSPTTSCSAVATYVYNVIKAANASGTSMNAMLKAQDLATSLDVYFSDPALGGNKINAPAPIGGVTVDLTKVCADIGTCSTYVDASSAFGGATSMTVSQILAYAASQSNAGGSIWYGQVKSVQELAKDVFDAINNQKIFAG